jgi:hypothetical protein
MLQSANLRSAILFLLGLVLGCGLIKHQAVVGQEPIEPPSPKPIPEVAYPTRLRGGFVPADVLLQQADARHPPTAEGWIVRDDPTNLWIGEFDPARRANDDFGYLVRLRQYDSQIRITRAEIDSWRRRLSVYRYFNKTGALFITTENTFLSLINLEEQLRNLRYERMLFMRQHHQERQTPIAEVQGSNLKVTEY